MWILDKVLAVGISHDFTISVYGEIGTQGTQPLACIKSSIPQPLACIKSSFPPIPAVHFPLWLHLRSSRCAGDKHSHEPRLVEKGFPQSQWLTIIFNIKLPF